MSDLKYYLYDCPPVSEVGIKHDVVDDRYEIMFTSLEGGERIERTAHISGWYAKKLREYFAKTGSQASGRDG